MPPTSTAHAPLLADTDDAYHDDVLSQPPAVSSSPHSKRKQFYEKPSFFVWQLTLSACISGLLFGYDTGVISATLVSVGTSLSSNPLTSLDKSVITSCTSLFALFASPAASFLADRLGRKPVIIAADTLFVLGSLCQAASGSVGFMVLGRSVVGVAVGAASFVAPLYVAELSPAESRGRLVTVNCLSITWGQVVAYLAGWLLVGRFGGGGGIDGEEAAATGWRWLVGLGALPAVLQMGLMFLMPETPRWLVGAGKLRAASQVLRKTLGDDDGGVEEVLRDIMAEVKDQGEEEEALLGHDDQTLHDVGSSISPPAKKSVAWLRAWSELVRVPRNRRALTIACLLQGLQQLCGFNSLMYFSATIFTLLGFSIPTLTSLCVAATNFVFTVGAFFLIDRIGRRHILLYTIPFMVTGLFLAALGFGSFDNAPADDAGPTAISARSGVFPSHDAAAVILISIMLYVAAYASGIGTVPWMQSELFSLNVRSLGSGVSTSTNWAANFVIGLTFLPLMDTLTPPWTFVLYGLICMVGWLLIWQFYPETGGLTLEEVSALFENGWGTR